ncbi:MAG: hypothetical protein ACJ762_10885 [Solirubrobacteraceae bacterium]
MALYVSVVLIAELAAVPERHMANGHVTGPIGGQLLEILWGTAIGLTLAHWFAFKLAAPAFRGSHVSVRDTYLALAQLAGAVLVAAITSLPVLLLSDVRAQETIGDIPAVIIGGVAYLVARRAGKAQPAAVFYGVTAAAVGIVVALVKTALAAH